MLGFYCINKPSGSNSTAVVSKVKRFTKQKCGHMGTLDPLAAGVLPVAVGKATKLFEYLLSKDKKYYAIGLFGVETDTLDADGNITKRINKTITMEDIAEVLPKFLGKIKQTPPKFSAVKVDGKRAYDLARRSAEFDIPQREVFIHNITACQIDTNKFSFEIECSSGTYIRTLIADIAAAVGTVATTVCIIRKKSGPFTLSNSCTLEELENGEAKLLSVDEILPLERIELVEEVFFKLSNGQTVIEKMNNGERLAYYNGKLLGIIETKNNHTKVKINLWEE